MKITINNKEIETQDYVDKWVKLSLEATPATDEEITNNMKMLYKKSNLKEPKKVIIFRDYDKFINQDWNSVNDSVSDSVCVCVCVCMCMYVYVSVCMCMYVYVCVCMCLYVYECV